MPDSTELDLIRRQLDGMAVWHRQRHAQEVAARAARTREQRLDRSRRMAVLREEHRAIIAATDASLRESMLLLGGTAPRAVVAHRDDWFAAKVLDELAGAGVQVVAAPHNGAEAVGAVVAEQPDLVLVEDVLPMLCGEDVVREVLACAPRTRVGAQVAHDDRVQVMLSAGATAAWARRVPPAEVARGLLALLQPRRPHDD
jgi:CheY-like chemotaxis protein